MSNRTYMYVSLRGHDFNFCQSLLLGVVRFVLKYVAGQMLILLLKLLLHVKHDYHFLHTFRGMRNYEIKA
jgi:hypothetical protein